MIAPTIAEQLETLGDAAQLLRGVEHPTIAMLRQAEVLDYIRNRIEVFANKAAANRETAP
jgi:hypothetical protein